MFFRSNTQARSSIVAVLAVSFLQAIPSTVCAEVKPVVDARPIPVDRGAAETWKLLKKLHTRASILMIVAHPDDEDGATLAYESRNLGAMTSLYTLDRGEGGANVMSADLWDALGLVRTEELLQAGRYYGLDGQYFSSMADYGFSKTLKEALGQWGHDRVLAEAVRVVRTVRPLIVCSVFVGGPTDGHGQHAVSGLMAQEVFSAAGDPTKFPEQIVAGLLPWTPVKVYARTPFFRTSEKGAYDYATHTWGPLGVTNHITGKWEPGQVATTVAVPVGTYDPIPGLTYPQISREGLAFQKSQNGGSDVPSANDQTSNYHRFGSHIASPEKEATFFDGIDTTLPGIATLSGSATPAFLTNGLAQVDGTVEAALKTFSATNPSAIAPTLAEGLKATNALVSQVASSALSADAKYNILHELHAKQDQFKQALFSSLAISVEAEVSPAPRGGTPGAIPAEFRGSQQSFQMATPGQAFHATVHLFNGGALPVEIASVVLTASSGKNWAPTTDTPAPKQLAPGKPADIRFTTKVPADEPYTRPYFTRPDLEQPFYNLAPYSPKDLPTSPYPLAVTVTLTYQGLSLETAKVVQVIDKVTGPGTLRFPMPVGPPVSVALSPSAGVIPLDEKSFPVTVRLRNNLDGQTKESIHLSLPPGWTSEPTSASIAFSHPGEEQSASFTVKPAVIAQQPYQIAAIADLNGKSYTEGYITVGYTGLRPYFLYSPALYKAAGTDVKVAPSQRIAYIEGSGDDVPAALESLGIHVAFLSAQDLAGADLSQYNTIVVGVRAYAVRPDLIANNGRLLKYAENGGIVLVQYNTPEYDHNYGPYPYVMTSDPEEVTDEHSVVSILEPNNPLFTWPNKITTKDFDNWVEERGSKFLSTWDPHYQALLETHDEDQPLQKGGLLYARYGKGAYIYNAYAFYRQLPLGVPGAYRLFANMLSLPKNPQFLAGK